MDQEYTDYEKFLFQILSDPIVWHVAQSDTISKQQLSLALDLLSCAKGRIQILCGASIPTTRGRSKADLRNYAYGLQTLDQLTLDTVNLVYAVGHTLSGSGLVYAFDQNSRVSIWWQSPEEEPLTEVIADPTPANAMRSVLRMKVTFEGLIQANYFLIGIKPKKGSIKIAKNIGSIYPKDARGRLNAIAMTCNIPECLGTNTRFCIQPKENRYTRCPLKFVDKSADDIYGSIAASYSEQGVSEIQSSEPGSFNQMSRKEEKALRNLQKSEEKPPAPSVEDNPDAGLELVEARLAALFQGDYS